MKQFLFLTVVISACSPTNRTRPSAPDAAPDVGSPDSSVDSGPADPCSDAAKKVYVLDRNNTFSTFDPMTQTFTDLGALSCPTADGASPWSMSVDRNAIAWVLYDDGTMFRLDPSTLACTATTWQATSDLFIFGMGFSTDTAGGTTDTLYVAGGATHAGATGGTFASIDMTAFMPTTIGMTTGFPELSGNSNAELWGFFPGDAHGFVVPHVDKLDKTAGTALSSFQLSALQGAPDAYAFANWGGDFWIFLDRDNLNNTTVFQINGTTGAVTSSMQTGGRVIVGAGVSTCAPVVIGRTSR